jgi:hypothetical protein
VRWIDEVLDIALERALVPIGGAKVENAEKSTLEKSREGDGEANQPRPH